MALSNRSYHAFLSFRGEDTRKNFVDHLYDSLTRNGITTFKDDCKEKSVASWKEIEESTVAIVVISKSYASSSWCLDELVKIMECSKKSGQLVLPVYYYDFSPSYLRRQGSVFGELFAKYDTEKVRAWSSVLVEAANLSGIGLIDSSYQATQINVIVETVMSKLNISKLYDDQNAKGQNHDTLGDTTPTHKQQLIGIDRRMQQVKTLLQVKPALASSSPRYSWPTSDVFMSYKPNDTCKDFADQLHCALEQHTICAYRVDQALARGNSVSLELLKAIEESSVAIIVFSENYAASSWCLDELVEIMNCNEKFGRRVFPIFYGVNPSDVRYQTGTFGEAFMRNKPEKVEIWREALVKAGTLAGWYLNCTSKSDEATVIKNIVDVISRRLDWSSLSVGDKLIGVDAQVKSVMSILKCESDSIIGICGMGGIGKTTIAKAVYNQVSTCFDSSCFVENIREVSKCHGLKHIQKEIVSRLLKDENLHARSNHEGADPIRHRLNHRKVLIVLDDVDDASQLEALAGSCRWFGEGSRIIITTRDETLLVAHNIMQTYYVKPLDDNKSYQFLRRHAFKKDDSTEAYEELFPQVVSYACGLPLALKVLSAQLCGKGKKEWISALARLQVFPEKRIQDALKISYDSLDAAEKELFLHIACFFNNMKKDYVVNILDSCGFFGDTGIRILEQKSLLCIVKGHIKMHTLVQQMGRDIVRQMHPDEPGKRSRLWLAEDIYDTLMDSKSMKEVDAIVVDDMHDYDYDAVDMTKALKSMRKLKLLQIHTRNKLRFLERSNYLPEKLRWLTWKNYPLRSLPASFEGNELVGLELLGSSISEPWHGTKFMWRLCFLDLSFSRNLIKTPVFTGIPNLKELKLEFCTSLIEVHESIGYLDRLRFISLRSCKSLNALPRSIRNLKSLRTLVLDGCLNLQHPMSMDYLKFVSDWQMIKLLRPVEFMRNVVELDLGKSSLSSLKFGLKSDIRSIIHELLLHKGRNIMLSECKTSQEFIEDKKENIALLPRKGV